jgi:mannose-6-phosphate isomerase-like protein (cupin superfamily)
MGVLYIPPGHGLAPEHTADSKLFFYVLSGKLIVCMRLTDFGGKTARFSVHKGGTWEVTQNTTYSMINGLSMAAQLLFWRYHKGAEDMGVCAMPVNDDGNRVEQGVEA